MPRPFSSSAWFHLVICLKRQEGWGVQRVYSDSAAGSPRSSIIQTGLISAASWAGYGGTLALMAAFEGLYVTPDEDQNGVAQQA